MDTLFKHIHEYIDYTLYMYTKVEWNTSFHIFLKNYKQPSVEKLPKGINNEPAKFQIERITFRFPTLAIIIAY